MLSMALSGMADAYDAVRDMGADEFTESRNQLASILLSGSKTMSAAEMMNNLPPNGQAELARILLIAIPTDGKERLKMLKDCVRMLKERRLMVLYHRIREDMQRQGLTPEEKNKLKLEFVEVDSLLRKL